MRTNYHHEESNSKDEVTIFRNLMSDYKDIQQRCDYSLSEETSKSISNFYEEDVEYSMALEAQREQEEIAMMSSTSGRAFRLVESVQRIAESLQLQTISMDDMIWLAERFIEKQEEFRAMGKDFSIIFGYHNTKPMYLESIRTHGLLSRGEQVGDRTSAGSGLYFGDGIYISNNPQTFVRYGSTGLLVAALVGNTQRINPGGMNNVENDILDTGVGNKTFKYKVEDAKNLQFQNLSPHDHDEIVLRNAAQCLPLIMYQTKSIVEKHGATARIIKECIENLQAVFNDIFDPMTGFVPSKIRCNNNINPLRPLRNFTKHSTFNSDIYDSLFDGEDSRLPLLEDLLNYNTTEITNEEMKRFIFRISNNIDEKILSTRQELAGIGLPDSLIEYTEEQASTGITPKLWKCIEQIQKSNQISTFKKEAWILRGIVNQAKHLLEKIDKDLQNDLEIDFLFRQENPDFHGTIVQKIQENLKRSLSLYKDAFANARSGDLVLSQKLEKLDKEFKFKLLHFRKSQLDCLLLGNKDNVDDTRQAMFDTTPLSRSLVELSKLFHQHDSSLASLNKVLNCDVQSVVTNVSQGRNALSSLVRKIQHDLSKQDELKMQIIELNKNFMAFQKSDKVKNNSVTSAASESIITITMIEDAVDEIGTISKYLSDGYDFYNSFISKLNRLSNEVADSSAQFVVDRCEFEDAQKLIGQKQGGEKIHETIQEKCFDKKDNEMKNNSAFNHLSNWNSTPGAVHVNNNKPQLKIDDEKVSMLLSMDFTLDNIVNALLKYDNHFEHALNELLS